ncbi:MAG: hypothetical protein ACI8TQ_001967 [Planctomycetota bacterium]
MDGDSKEREDGLDQAAVPESQAEPVELDWDVALPPLPEPEAEQLDSWSPKNTESLPPLEPLGPRWHQAELAWPIALFAGFAGSSLGVASGLPGVGPLAAMILFAPLYLGLIHRNRTGLAALISIGWLAAVGAAAAGAVLDEGFSAIARSCPGSIGLREAEILPWLEGDRSGPASGTFLRNFYVGVGLLLVARHSIGLVSLAGLALCASAIGASVGWFATETLSMEPATACILGIPPHHAFSLAGLLLLVAVLSDRRQLLPLSEITDVRRNLMVAGAALLVLGFFVEPLLSRAWGTWMSEAVG